MQRVVVVKSVSFSGGRRPGPETYRRLLEVGLAHLAGLPPAAALRSLLPGGTIGMKVNALVGPRNSTPPALTAAAGDLLEAAGWAAGDLIVWDRSNRELDRAGFTLNVGGNGRRCFGTDTAGFGYTAEIHTYGEVGSRVSRVLTEAVDSNINLPVLKNHSIVGLSGGLKNMYGAIHNPNKYHDHCGDPYCAHVSLLEPVRRKNRLTIADAVLVQYHGGPGFREEHVAPYGAVLLSDDPVAVDRVGLEIIEYLRARAGLGTLAEDKRAVTYLDTAACGLGAADLARIDVIVRAVDGAGRETSGELFS
ncbi:MAG TPA: DUF362 domain-containing protein [candidate division Zixibacteria bacterium]|nr:DUF362 domain-containing protein [candidate division Zixibacteria bacterium]